jgi:antitoxin component YwqK of YwqJK toxin-antitoxin module
MPKLKLIILILFLNVKINAQEKNIFNDFYEILNDNFKIYINQNYHIEHKDCADFYIICKINNNFELVDTLKVYDKKNNLRSIGFFNLSKPEGSFESFYDNGKLMTKGSYTNGKKNGIWYFYYDNGKLKKSINFLNNYGKIIEFYNKKGKNTVINGNGHYEDEIKIGNLNNTHEIEGSFVNGMMDGKWKIKLNGSEICEETYINGLFKSGLSFSSYFGNEMYTINSFATFIENIEIENIKINVLKMCKNNKILYTSFEQNLYSDLYNVILENIEKYNNSRYFIEIKIDENNIFKKAIVYPDNIELSNLINSSLKYKKYTSKLSISSKLGKNSLGNILMVLLKDDVYFNGNKGVKLIDNYLLNNRP